MYILFYLVMHFWVAVTYSQEIWCLFCIGIILFIFGKEMFPVSSLLLTTWVMSCAASVCPLTGSRVKPRSKTTNFCTAVKYCSLSLVFSTSTSVWRRLLLCNTGWTRSMSAQVHQINIKKTTIASALNSHFGGEPTSSWSCFLQWCRTRTRKGCSCCWAGESLQCRAGFRTGPSHLHLQQGRSLLGNETQN